MKQKNIGFVGGGNMAASLVGGLIADGFPGERIWVADPDAQRREGLRERFGVNVTGDNVALVGESDVVVLAVKPQVMREVASGIGPAVRAHAPLVVSVAAGVRTADLERWLGGEVAIVRTMPNTPALVRSGATGLFANPRVGDTQRELAEHILRAVGLTLWLADEDLLDAVTAVSGSGPAYFFLVIEALEAAGTRLGLAPRDARLLALQTAFGAAKMALESPDDSATLRKRVTSPGGTTERAIGVLEDGDLRGLLDRAVTAARDRARELADLLGAQ